MKQVGSALLWALPFALGVFIVAVLWPDHTHYTDLGRAFSTAGFGLLCCAYGYYRGRRER